MQLCRLRKWNVSLNSFFKNYWNYDLNSSGLFDSKFIIQKIKTNGKWNICFMLPSNMGRSFKMKSKTTIEEILFSLKSEQS